MRKHICGTPKEFCSGSNFSVGKGLLFHLVHQTAEEAFKCHASYLVTQKGHIQVGSREFKDPTDGYIRVLTKKSRFGAPIRKGKTGQDGNGKRGMFVDSMKGTVLSL